MVVALFIFLALATSRIQAGIVPMTDDLKALILKEHNDYRVKQHASNMQELVWDDQLEQEATAWIQSCRFEHQMAGRGENLAFNSNPGSYEELISHAMQSWYDEIRLFRGRSCAPSSCHYTQIVWAETDHVGCGMINCSSLYAFGRGISNAWYFACFYTPKGNDISQTPFLRGAACSHCLNAQTCTIDGLCHGEGQKVCVNKDGDEVCDEWQSWGECDRNPNYMSKSCAKACNTCG